MKRIFSLLAVLLTMAAAANAQKAMTPPHIMVVPDNSLCGREGWVRTMNGETVPDYEKALNSDKTIHDVLIQVAELITDRNSSVVIVDLMQAINNAKADADMSGANGGDQSETVDEAIIRNSDADIIIKVDYDILVTGPQKQIKYSITGTDAYTSQMFAPISGTGNPSTSANPVILLQEAVYNKMDAFLDKVFGYYNNMFKSGRMVAFDIKCTNTASHNMNSKVGQYTLREEIEDFLFDNSVDGAGVDRVKSGATFMQFDGVYIPLVSTIRGRQRRQGAKDVAQKMVEFLASKGVTAEFKTRGLGRVNIYIK